MPIQMLTPITVNSASDGLVSQGRRPGEVRRTEKRC